MRVELERIRRVSDQLVTAHSVLAERYGRRAFFLDLAILGASVWLNAMVFIEPMMLLKLSPAGIDRNIFIGLLAIATFFLSLFQMKAEWKGRAESHNGARKLYASVKAEVGYLLSREDTEWRAEEVQRVLDRYDTAGLQGVAIPEADFNNLKRHHKLKIEVSRYLDDHPGAWIFLLRIKIWCRDNCRVNGPASTRSDKDR